MIKVALLLLLLSSCGGKDEEENKGGDSRDWGAERGDALTPPKAVRPPARVSPYTPEEVRLYQEDLAELERLKQELERTNQQIRNLQKCLEENGG